MQSQQTDSCLDLRNANLFYLHDIHSLFLFAIYYFATGLPSGAY